MRRFIAALTAVSIAASVLPAAAQASSCQRRAHNAKVTGTILGAIGGALIGNAVSHHGGAIVGGVGGAVVGNQLSRHSCKGYSYRSGYAYRHYHHYYGRPTGYYGRPEGYAYGPTRRCTMQTQSFYNERGELITRQVQNCA